MRPIDRQQMVVDIWQIALAIMLGLIPLISIAAYRTSPIDNVDLWGVISLSSSIFLALLTIVVAAILISASRRVAEIIIGVALATIIGDILGVSYAVLLRESWSYTHWVIGHGLTVLPAALFVFALLHGAGWSRFLRAALFAGIFSGSQMAQSLYLPYAPLFVTDQGVSDAQTTDYQQLDIETLYYAQPSLMQEQTAGLRQGTADTIDLFGLTIAGHAAQGVFLREVESVSALLAETYDASDRIIHLANSADHPNRYPLANTPNIKASLKALSEKIDAKDDIVFLFMTSHGASEQFSLNFWQARINPLPAVTFSELLDNSDIQNMVIVISACYSGSFIDALKTPDRMIVTASSAENTSFGCADKNDWTWWGRAYFDQALRQDRDFRSAFKIAQGLILDWEEKEGVSASDPQIFVGSRIAGVLDGYFSQSAATTGN